MTSADDQATAHYDVAISFKAADEPFAAQLAELLQPALTCFVYSKRQEDLAGRDGVEAFREVFRHRNSLSVVLHRDGWGETPWTRVEETAIRDRCLADGWRHLMVVRMDRAPLRTWIPDTHLYFDPESFGIEALAGAIKARCVDLGVELRKGTLAERIRLRHEREEFDKETRRLLDASNEAFRNEFRALCEALGTCAREIEAQTGRTLVDGDTAYGAFMVFDKPVTVQLLPEELYANTARDAHLAVRFFYGRLLTRAEAQKGMHVWPDPEEFRRDRLDLTRLQATGWVWKSRNKFLSSAAMAEELTEALLSARDERLKSH